MRLCGKCLRQTAIGPPWCIMPEPVLPRAARSTATQPTNTEAFGLSAWPARNGPALLKGMAGPAYPTEGGMVGGTKKSAERKSTYS